MGVEVSPDVARLAGQGLEKVNGAWTRAGKVARAEQAVQDLVRLGDPAVERAAKVGLAAAHACPRRSQERLAMLQETLSILQTRACGSVGFQAELASALRERLSSKEPERAEALRAMLAQQAENARRQELPEAPYLEFLQGLSPLVGDPSGLLNASHRVTHIPLEELNGPTWVATVTCWFTDGLDFQPEQGKRVLDYAFPILEKRADDPSRAWLESYRQLAAQVEGPESQLQLKAGLMRVLSRPLPPTPEAMLQLIQNRNGWGPLPDRDRRKLTDFALSQALAAPESQKSPWMRFYEATRSVEAPDEHGRPRLRSLALSRLDQPDFRPTSFLVWMTQDLSKVLAAHPADSDAPRVLWDALGHVQPDPQARVELGVAVADLLDSERQVPVLRLACELARQRVADHPGAASLDALLRSTLQSAPTDSDQARAYREAINRWNGLENDPQLQMLTAMNRKTDGVREEAHQVVVGGVPLRKKNRA